MANVVSGGALKKIVFSSQLTWRECFGQVLGCEWRKQGFSSDQNHPREACWQAFYFKSTTSSDPPNNTLGKLLAPNGTSLELPSSAPNEPKRHAERKEDEGSRCVLSLPFGRLHELIGK